MIRDVFFQVSLPDHVLYLVLQLDTLLSVVARRLVELTPLIFIFSLIPLWEWSRLSVTLLLLRHTVNFGAWKRERSVGLVSACV